MYIYDAYFKLVLLKCFYCSSGKQKSLIDSMHKENEELSNLLNESEVQNMVSKIILLCS